MVCRNAFIAMLLAAVFAPTAAGLPAEIYLNDSVNQLLAFDTDTNEVSLVGDLAAQFTDIAFSPEGDLYGTTPRYLYQIDPADGWSTLIADHGFNGFGIDALTFDTDGTLYAAGNDVLIAIDIATGLGAQVGHLSGYRSAGDMTVDSTGRLLLATDAGDLVEIHRDGSGVTTIGSLPYGDIFSLAVAEDGTILGFRGADEVLSIDPLSGQATLVGNLEADFLVGYPWGAAFPPLAHTPEPASLVLLVAGAMVVGRRRRF